MHFPNSTSWSSKKREKRFMNAFFYNRQIFCINYFVVCYVDIQAEIFLLFFIVSIILLYDAWFLLFNIARDIQKWNFTSMQGLKFHKSHFCVTIKRKLFCREILWNNIICVHSIYFKIVQIAFVWFQFGKWLSSVNRVHVFWNISLKMIRKLLEFWHILIWNYWCIGIWTWHTDKGD